MLTFSQSQLSAFLIQDRPDGRRLGQRFCDYFQLHKVTNPDDKVWINRVYNAQDLDAEKMIDSRTDYMQ